MAVVFFNHGSTYI